MVEYLVGDGFGFFVEVVFDEFDVLVVELVLDEVVDGVGGGVEV